MWLLQFYLIITTKCGYNPRKLEQRAATVSPKWFVKKETVKVVFRLGTIQVILRTTRCGQEWCAGEGEEKEKKKKKKKTTVKVLKRTETVDRSNRVKEAGLISRWAH